MAGLIRKEDVVLVREAARIDEIVGEHVILRPAGVGSLKGLCPFHDERTPSFHIRPHLEMWHCFGCGEGGDIISFVQKIDHLSFTEAVEFLAQRAGITFHYEEGGTQVRSEKPRKRQRLLEAHRVAGEFYQRQLASAEGAVGRQFLAKHGSNQAICTHFGVGYSPDPWDALTRHLRSKSFTDKELEIAGLASCGNRGLYDRFRGCLMWPIRDITGVTVDLGARHLNEDPQPPKYLNTPETPIYKKSQLLYGLGLAKEAIAKEHRIATVEGYTDVMAAHVAGEPCAIATCGTAFGSEHAKIVHRLLGDATDPAAGVLLSNGRARGPEVIFTFGSDAAGQKAALRAFREDQNSASQTFVAIDREGTGPCEVRMARGDKGVIELVRPHTPFFEFVTRSAIRQVDLYIAEGRVRALSASASIVASIRDRALRMEYTRSLAGWLGMSVRSVADAVRHAVRPAPEPRYGETSDMAGAGFPSPVPRRRGPEDPITRLERQTLEIVLQRPVFVIGSGFEDLEGDSFFVPAHRVVHDAIRACGGFDAFTKLLHSAERYFGIGERVTEATSRHFINQVRDAAGELVGAAVAKFVVTPLPQNREEEMRSYYRGVVAALIRTDLTRKLGEARGRLQRMDKDDPEYAKAFRELVRLESRRQTFTERN